jgi:hypothetical protein
MATFIRRMCPWVRLYVAKLDEGFAADRRKQITAESAAKVCPQTLAGTNQHST